VRTQSSIFLLIISVLGLLHTSAFFLYWLINGIFYADVNNFLFTKLGKRFDYIRLIQTISLLMLLWSIVLLALLLQKGYKPGWIAWLYLVAITLYFFFFYGSFWFLFSQAPVQWVRILRIVGYFRLILDFILLVGLIFVLRAIGMRFSGWDSGKIIAGVTCLLIYIFLWCLPLISPPGSVYKDPLPARPRLIAHRGASILVPENTLSAARQAEALGADGLEVDIRISLDGVPFLMHDSSLQRTTDVASIFPGRAGDRPENFTLAELKQLNAGEWFYRDDPYKTIAKGLVQPFEIQEIRQERIPTLAEILDFLKVNDQVFLFDLISPPPDHPFSAQFFNICFSQLHQAGLDSRIWFLAKGEEKKLIASSAPGMVLAYGADYANPPAAQALVEQGYQVLNVEYGLPLERIPEDQQAGLKVNLYVVDEPWLFSQAWLAGVDSITTNNVHSMIALNQPAFGLTRTAYRLLWGLVGILGLGILFMSFWFLKY
jgi:glycerophosphoinositol inositolphosphodiesterase